MKVKTLMKTWLKPLPLGLSVVVLAVVGLLARNIFFKPPALPQVTTALVEKGDLEDSVLATGTINAYRLVSVGARATGEVKRLHVALGDEVKQGQLIAEIDALTQQNTLRDAQAALRSAEALLVSKQAALKQADLTARRQRELTAAEVGTPADLESAEAALETAQANVDSQKALIAQARVAVDTAEVNLGYAQVLAPMDGTVVAIMTEQGQTVNASQSAPTIVKLAKLDTMTIKAKISEADAPRVRPGMPVYFSLLGEPDHRIEAKLRAVEPGDTTLSDSSTTSTSSSTSSSSSSSSTTSAIYYNGIFDVPNPGRKLQINMTAQVTIVLAQAKDVLTIPATALGARDAKGNYRVQVLEGDHLVDKTVQVGLNNRVRAQVLSGLQAGDKVVTSEAKVGATGGNTRGGPPMF